MSKHVGRVHALKKLGIQVSDLLASVFSSPSGSLRRSEYNMFWSQMSLPSEATVFLIEIANRLIQTLDSSSASGAHLDQLLTTLNFILLHLELNVNDPRVSKFLEQWNKLEASKSITNLYPQTKEIIRLLTHLLDPSTPLLSSLILCCITMHSIREFEKMNDQSYALDDHVHVNGAYNVHHDLKHGESAFYYEYIKKIARDGWAVPSKHPPLQNAHAIIVQNTVSKIVTLPQQMKMNPLVAETTFNALIYMLKNLLCIMPLQDAMFIKSFMSTMQPFYLWPLPFGAQAAALLNMLNLELALPGFSHLTKQLREMETACILDNSEENSMYNGLSSLLFYVYDAQSSDSSSMIWLDNIRARPWSAARGPRSSTDQAPLCTPSVQANIIAVVFALAGQTLSEQEVEQLTNISADSLLIIFKKVTAMLREMQDKQGKDDVKEVRNRALKAIKEQLATLPPSADKKDCAKFTGLSPSLSLSLPSLTHHSLALAPPPGSIALPTYEFVDRDQWKMCGFKTAPFVSVPFFEILSNLVASFRSERSLASPIRIRLMISGGDDVLHQVLCAWCLMRQSRAEQLEGIKLLFYLLPTHRNHMANFIARHDSWYNRHIFVPCRSPSFLLPWMQLSPADFEAQDAKQEDADISPPGQWMRRNFESYARESDQSMDMCVYRFEGYLTADSGVTKGGLTAPPIPQAGATTVQPAKPIAGPDHLIPFVQRVDVGIYAAAMEYRRAKKQERDPNVRLDDVLRDKGFDYVPIDLTVKFTRLNLDFQAQEPIVEDAATYTQLLVNNVPRKGDPTFAPNPTVPCLEFAAKMHKNFQKNPLKKNTLVQDGKQHIQEIEIAAAHPNQTFMVGIDGQLFGPYHHVRICPCLDEKDNKHMKFPIQNFFPFEA